MVFVDEGKEIKIGDKTFIIHRAPATVAYDVAIRHQIATDKQDPDEMVNCLLKLLKYVEVVLVDGRKVTLENQEIINQHLQSPQDLLALQREAVSVNFTSSASENH